MNKFQRNFFSFAVLMLACHTMHGMQQDKISFDKPAADEIARTYEIVASALQADEICRQALKPSAYELARRKKLQQQLAETRDQVARKIMGLPAKNALSKK